MKQYGWMLVVMLAFAACSDSHDRAPGSQTHFLESCEDTCAAPYACVCGVCTLHCSKDAQCTDHATNAACSVARSEDDRQCGATVCDISCSGDGDCRSLGDGFVCDAGRCRAVPVRIDAGSKDSGTHAGANASDAATTTGRDAAATVFDAATTADGGDAKMQICDGSDGIRLGMWSGGGFVNNAYPFLYPYGRFFAFVDGHCRFYASNDVMTGIASGTLSAAEADQLAREVRYAQIATFSQHHDASDCADGGSSAISDGAHTFGCDCDCDADAPAGLADAEAASTTWITNLVASGDLSDGPVRAAAIEVATDASSPSGDAWPLAWPIADIVVPNSNLVEESGLDIGDPADTTALRALRSKAAKASVQIGIVDSTASYMLFVRDELPTDVAAAVKTLPAAVGR
jgi:hypothetical protein